MFYWKVTELLDTTTVWHENFIVIKFYSLPLNHLDENSTDFNFIEVQFHTQGHGDIIIVPVYGF